MRSGQADHCVTRQLGASQQSEACDHVTPVLRKAVGFMGINDVGGMRAGGSLAANLGKVRIEGHHENLRLRLGELTGS